MRRLTSLVVFGCLAVILAASPRAEARILVTDTPNDFDSSANIGLFFDLTAIHPVTITALDAYSATLFDAQGGGLFTIDIYTRLGSAVGHETTPGDWTLLDTVSGVDTNIDAPELLPLSVPLGMPAGKPRAFYVVGTVGGLQWIDSCGSLVFSNADLSLTAPSGTNDLFARVDECKQFAGSVHYDVDQGAPVPEPGTLTLVVIGLAGLARAVRKRLLPVRRS